MDLGDIMISEESQMEKDKYHMISLIYGIKKKLTDKWKNQKKKKRKKETHRYREQSSDYPRGEVVEDEMDKGA